MIFSTICLSCLMALLAASGVLSEHITPTSYHLITNCDSRNPESACYSLVHHQIHAEVAPEQFESTVPHAIAARHGSHHHDKDHEHHDESHHDTSESQSCEMVQSEYDVPLRVGILFVILVTSAIGVYGPIVAQRYQNGVLKYPLLVLKQFGTGVIISTALIHLSSEATAQFNNPCLGDRVKFESASMAITMAGIVTVFVIDYCCQRLVRRSATKEAAAAIDGQSSFAYQTKLHNGTEMLNVMILEAGIIFHSLLIGITLVVSQDKTFRTLVIVIIFHQIFEGIALGTRIAALGSSKHQVGQHHHHHGHSHTHDHVDSCLNSEPSHQVGAPHTQHNSAHDHESSQTEFSPETSVPVSKKMLLASCFAFVTPLGMAIGLGLLKHFNDNDPTTIIVVGTLGAFTAGVLIWVGLVEMLAEDWMMGGEMTTANPLKTALGFAGLLAGMALMTVLAIWA